MFGAKTIAIFFAACADRLFTCCVETCRANHHVDAGFGASLQMSKGGFWASEVDQDIRFAEGRQIGDYRNSGGTSEKFCAIASRRWTVGAIERRRDCRVGLRQRRFDQHATHAAGGAGDRKFQLEGSRPGAGV